MHVTVTCGCGRKMTPDALKGRGAYRCGCGTRIRFEEIEERCVARERGWRCSSSPKTGGPAPLCNHHLVEMKATLGLFDREDLDDFLIHYTGAAFEGPPRVEDESVRLRRLAAQRRAAEEGARQRSDLALTHDGRGIVYYIQFDTRIKIGTTTNFRKRMDQLPHDLILAVEPGGVFLERQRHKDFAAYRITGEWFSMGPELMQHIAMLRRNPCMWSII